MKKPEEIKKGLEALKTCHDLMAFNPATGEEIDPLLMNADNRELYYGVETVIAYIQQLEANWQQVSKALCGKDLATLEELLQGASQVKSELSAVKQERDAAVRDIIANCAICKHHDHERICCKLKITLSGEYADDCVKFEWRGVCPENSSDERSCLNCKHQGADGRGICMDCGMDYRKWQLLETEVQGDG